MRREIPAGIRISYTHTDVMHTPKNRSVDDPRQATIARAWDDEGLVAWAFAMCSPRDQFNKRLGREISLGRVLKQLEDMGYVDNHGYNRNSELKPSDG